MSVSFDFQSNATNKVTYIILLICFLFLHILSIISMFRIRKDLCDLQDFLNSRFTLMLPPENSSYSLGGTLWFVLPLLSSFVVPAGFAKTLTADLDYGTLGFVATYLIIFFNMFVNFAPPTCLTLLHFEIFRLVNRWLQKLQKMVEDPYQPIIRVLREIEKFCCVWKQINSFTSFPIFVSYTISVFELIVIVYTSISLFLDDPTATIDIDMILQASGLLLLSLVVTQGFVFTSFYGEKIGEQVEILKGTLHDQFIINPGESDEVVKLNKLVLSHLSGWKNLNGYGFFTIGKSFLTSLLANFLTYIIILLQFNFQFAD